MSIGPLDLAVLLGYMGGMVLLGVWLGRGARDSHGVDQFMVQRYYL